MKTTIYSVSGSKTGDVNLPSQFNEPIRADLIKRAVLAMQSHTFQPNGTDPEAGKKYASKLSRRRRAYRGGYGIGISRVPRKIMNSRGTRFNWQAATVPNTVGGRLAHPPKPQKIISEKINKKERRKAIRSALAATLDKELVEKRGHKVSQFPLIVEDKAELLDKTKDVIAMFSKLGLDEELSRSSQFTMRTGKSRLRSRRKKNRVGPLLVVGTKNKIIDAASNIPGVDVCVVDELNAHLLAPGTHPGRLTIYTTSALTKLEKNKLFTDNPITQEQKKQTIATSTKKPTKKVVKKTVTKKETVPTQKVSKKLDEAKGETQ